MVADVRCTPHCEGPCPDAAAARGVRCPRAGAASLDLGMADAIAQASRLADELERAADAAERLAAAQVHVPDAHAPCAADGCRLAPPKPGLRVALGEGTVEHWDEAGNLRGVGTTNGTVNRPCPACPLATRSDAAAPGGPSSIG
jgi:hypothetical protein